MSLTIECQQRPEGSKPNALRREGYIPANLYGHDGANSVALMVNAKEAVTLLKKAAANETVIEVNIPHLSWTGNALIREIQAHPWKKNLLHLSFFYVGNTEGLTEDTQA
ncbi:ribosomal protein L25 [Rippkaea orientalis PCC 8801]|uniref:Ribosomal protein L25 n=1 Tax=Rippkaea orientalis (strain PCC 8801 / RF-1) TaxID=41431 RepID=B7JXN5_RIPO1|nr:50S ribosomal protein L25 [Rippkaea orientalis]ACK64792.1 ribosomal protein L25 [Rippkaea orientalis PCC 8801]